ncbi:hypothetical protein SDC9_74179 [bioreactor metagenome]|uniref:Uncharacterized protein n=1 Tax=bioreactor metagenome TaxID=1076179 RepID=A0A644YGN7_9ZZZZ
MQRVVARLGEQLIGPDHHHGVMVLDRDSEVTEADVLEQPGLLHRRRDEGLGGRGPVLLHDPLVERAGVDTDPQRHLRIGGGLGDLGDLVVELLDVARVHPDRGTPGLDRLEHVARLEVDVGDDRDLGLLGDDVQYVGVVLARNGDPDDVAAGGGQLGDLLEGPIDVGGLRGGHGLHRDGSVATDLHRAHPQLARDVARSELDRGGCGHSETCCHATRVGHLSEPAPPGACCTRGKEAGTDRIGRSDGPRGARPVFTGRAPMPWSQVEDQPFADADKRAISRAPGMSIAPWSIG